MLFKYVVLHVHCSESKVYSGINVCTTHCVVLAGCRSARSVSIVSDGITNRAYADVPAVCRETIRIDWGEPECDGGKEAIIGI